MRSPRRAVVLLAVLLALLLPGTARAQRPLPPGLGIRLLEVPTAAADDPRAQIYVVDHVPPGTVVERRIEIANGDPDAVEVELYAVGAEVTDDGFVADPGRARNDLATWTTVDPPDRTLQPGERATATVRIEVPQDAAAGERYGVVYAERGAAGSGLSVATRVGVRIYLSVGEGAAPAADFVIDGLTATRSEDGPPVLQATVRNTGGRALDLGGEMALSEGPGGTSAGPFEVTDVVTVAPGATTDVAVALDPAIPAGPWLASVTLRSGLLERGVQARVTFPDAGQGGRPATGLAVTDPAPEQDGGRTVPLPLLLGVGLLLAAAWLARRALGRARPETPPAEVEPPEVRPVARPAPSVTSTSWAPPPAPATSPPPGPVVPAVPPTGRWAAPTSPPPPPAA